MSKKHKRGLKQGKFIPRNLEKYAGKVDKIYYRSSWEYKFMNYCDLNPSILNWNSEEIVIQYICKTDNKPHRYYPDFLIKYKDKDNNVKVDLIEIKPHAETKPPKNPKNKSYQYQLFTYIKNQSKWEAAKLYCETNNYGWKILTEYELGIKNINKIK